MKKIYNTAQKSSFRRWGKKIFSSWIKNQSCNCLEEIEEIHRQLQKMDELINILAREVHRLSKLNK